MKQVKVGSLVPGDVVVLVWRDAAEDRDRSEYYKPGNVGHPGVRRLSTGIVVTNEDGFLRIAERLNYFRESEDRDNVSVRNSYLEIPWGWIDIILHFGSVKDILLELWEAADA